MNDPSTKRKMRPRDPVASVPTSISQLTSLVNAGIDARRFLEFVRTHKIPATKVGKLVVVDAGDLRQALRDAALVHVEELTPDTTSEDDDDNLLSADDVLRKIGHHRT